MYEDSPALDEHDPNYDSEEETGYEYIPRVAPLDDREDVAQSKITLSSYKKAIEPFITEYFVSEDLDELLCSVQELGAPAYSYELVKRAVNMSLDKADRERELVSKMISSSYPDMLSSNMIGKGFERLFEIMDEIEKDAPQAKDMISTFLARCVIDEVNNLFPIYKLPPDVL